MNRWERTLEGEGQVVLIVGDAGIGKSRLVQKFRDQIANTPHIWVEAAAAALYQNSPFYPIAEIIKQTAGLRGDQTAHQQLELLEHSLEIAGLEAAEAGKFIGPLLGIGAAANYSYYALSPDQQRRRLLAILTEWLLRWARVQPLVVTI